MFLVTFDSEHTYIKKSCYTSGVEWKSCEISNHVFIFENKRRTGYEINSAK